MKKICLAVFLFLGLGFQWQTDGLELDSGSQAKLIRALLSYYQPNLRRIEFAVIREESGRSRDLFIELQKTRELEIGDQRVPFRVLYLTDAQLVEHRINAYFCFDSAPVKSLAHAISFSNNMERVRQGFLLGIALEGTTPTVYLSLSQARSLKASYPPKMMKFITVIGEESNQ